VHSWYRKKGFILIFIVNTFGMIASILQIAEYLHPNDDIFIAERVFFHLYILPLFFLRVWMITNLWSTCKALHGILFPHRKFTSFSSARMFWIISTGWIAIYLVTNRLLENAAISGALLLAYHFYSCVVLGIAAFGIATMLRDRRELLENQYSEFVVKMKEHKQLEATQLRKAKKNAMRSKIWRKFRMQEVFDLKTLKKIVEMFPADNEPTDNNFANATGSAHAITIASKTDDVKVEINENVDVVSDRVQNSNVLHQQGTIRDYKISSMEDPSSRALHDAEQSREIRDKNVSVDVEQSLQWEAKLGGQSMSKPLRRSFLGVQSLHFRRSPKELAKYSSNSSPAPLQIETFPGVANWSGDGKVSVSSRLQTLANPPNKTILHQRETNSLQLSEQRLEGRELARYSSRSRSLPAPIRQYNLLARLRQRRTKSWTDGVEVSQLQLQLAPYHGRDFDYWESRNSSSHHSQYTASSRPFPPRSEMKTRSYSGRWGDEWKDFTSEFLHNPREVYNKQCREERHKRARSCPPTSRKSVRLDPGVTSQLQPRLEHVNGLDGAPRETEILSRISKRKEAPTKKVHEETKIETGGFSQVSNTMNSRTSRSAIGTTQRSYNLTGDRSCTMTGDRSIEMKYDFPNEAILPKKATMSLISWEALEWRYRVLAWSFILINVLVCLWQISMVVVVMEGECDFVHIKEGLMGTKTGRSVHVELLRLLTVMLDVTIAGWFVSEVKVTDSAKIERPPL